MIDIRRLLAYDLWASAQLLEIVAILSDDDFGREVCGELGSVRQQGVHLVSVADRYRARIVSDPVPNVDFHSFTSGRQLLNYSREVAARMKTMIESLPDERLAEEIRHETKRGVFVMTVEQTLMHVVNHGTYHRGQIACLLKMLGVEPVDTDIVIWWNLPGPPSS